MLITPKILVVDSSKFVQSIYDVLVILDKLYKDKQYNFLFFISEI